MGPGEVAVRYAPSMEKTHAMRVLDARGIAYKTKTYAPSGAFHSAEEAATLLGVAAETVYKTLVVLREGVARAKPMLVLIPADTRMDLKKLANGIGEKKLRMATQREAEQLTGMQTGGISALGVLRPASFEVLIDETAASIETIHISAGVRGVDLALNVNDFVGATAARYVGAV